MANEINTDFLKFSAYSIKDMITKKLSQDSNFTDQVYEGSNLAILIDIVSYMFQCLVYQLNNAASESMFADTQLYENMVRLVKFLDYNPRGCTPATMSVLVRSDQEAVMPTMLPFTTIDTGLTDSQGQRICFSTGLSLQPSDAEDGFVMTVFNGEWQLYGTIFTSSGMRNQEFTLDELYSDSDNGKYVANDFIKIITYDPDTDEYSDEWTLDVNGIFMATGFEDDKYNDRYMTPYTNMTPVYALTLNESKQYVLKFGDGITGKLLKKGVRVYVLYLNTNGEDGKVDADAVDFSGMKFKIPQAYRNFSESMLQKIYGTAVDPTEFESYQYTVSIVKQDDKAVVSNAAAEESVDRIRENAPNWFKTGNRLITRSDYEYFFKNRLSQVLNGKSDNMSSTGDAEQTMAQLGIIYDVKCMNNVEYVATFMKWLYSMGLKRKQPNGRYYLADTSSFFARTNYCSVDPADSNNVYMWIKSEYDYSYDQINYIQSQCAKVIEGIKTMTSELVVVKPVAVMFDLCAADDTYAKENYFQTDWFDENCETRLEIMLDDDVTYVANMIQQKVYDIIVKAFDQEQVRLGQKIDVAAVTNDIYGINGVKRVRTVWKNLSTSSVARTVDGVSFATWTDRNVLDGLEDFQVGNSIRHIEDFQYPRFNGEKLLLSRIDVIKKQLTVVNSLKF